MGKLTPLGHRVVAKQADKQDKTASGILIAKEAQEAPNVAKVIAVGDKVTEVKVGDEVIYSQAYSQTIEHEGDELLLLKVDSEELEVQGDILAVIGK